VLRCFGGDAWKEHGSLEIESGPGLSGLLTVCGADAAAATRQRILDKIVAINVDPPEPSICESYKEPAEGE
jgi:hypothetical protein